MNKTSIEYLTHTWNPIAMKCTKLSPACVGCWHLAMARRLATNPMIPDEVRAAYAGEVLPILIEERLTEPLRRKKPAMIGVQFMGDLFHKNIPDEFIFRVLGIIAECPQHVFQILTKRPKRMAYMWRHANERAYPNLWLGITIEKPEYSYRADYLRKTPARVRFISFEPLLASFADCPGVLDDIDLAIVGGETGPGARPMNPQWVQSLRDQCQEAEVSFFFKQWGQWASKDHSHVHSETEMNALVDKTFHKWADDSIMYRVRGKDAGRLLDGRTWDEMPEVTR